MNIHTLLRTLCAFLILSFSFSAFAELTPVDLNRASAQDIATVMGGVGEKKAQAIVTYREQFGPFKQVDDLLNVKGIGQATIENNRAVLIVGDAKP